MSLDKIRYKTCLNNAISTFHRDLNHNQKNCVSVLCVALDRLLVKTTSFDL
jgi:hypothetical protein